MGNPYTNGINIPTASDIYSGVQNLIGGTTMAGEAMAAGLGGLGGAVLGQWLNPMMTGRGVGFGGLGGVDTGTQTILNQELINNRFDQITANNDSQTSILQNNNLMKVLSDLGIQTALVGGVTEQAKDAAVNAGAQAVYASTVAGEKAVAASMSVGATMLASLGTVAKDIALNSTLVAKDTIIALTATAAADSLAVANSFRELSIQGLQTKYENSILATLNTQKILDSTNHQGEEILEAIAQQNTQRDAAIIAELNRKLTLSQTHVLLEEEFEEHERKRSRRDSEVTNINVNNNNTQVQNQIADLTNVVRSLLLSRPTGNIAT